MDYKISEEVLFDTLEGLGDDSTEIAERLLELDMATYDPDNPHHCALANFLRYHFELGQGDVAVYFDSIRVMDVVVPTSPALLEFQERLLAGEFPHLLQ